MRPTRLRTIKRLRQQILDPLLAEHKGRIVKLMGDGAIVEFASVVDAVACAVALQNDVASQSEGHSARSPASPSAVGVNLGDVVVEGDDLFGDGVNIAARLEALAEPGGICISDAVQSATRRKDRRSFSPIAGEQQLKNIARPSAGMALGERPGSGSAG